MTTRLREAARRAVKSPAVRRLMPGITPLCRRVCLRFDDYHQANDPGAWKRTLARYSEQGLRGVVAVCPTFEGEPLAAEEAGFLELLRADGWEIAQHGYTHEDIADAGYRSEFRGVDPEEQRRRVGAGKDLLEERGFSPRTFIPPWHQFDGATLRALRDHGFDCLNEGRWPLPRRKHGVTLVPTHPPGLHVDTIAVGVITLVGHPHIDADPMANAGRVAGHEGKVRTPAEVADWWRRTAGA